MIKLLNVITTVMNILLITVRNLSLSMFSQLFSLRGGVGLIYGEVDYRVPIFQQGN